MELKLRKWFSYFLAFLVLMLIYLGALVTSNGAGLAVPDWPNSFNYPMLRFPFDRWTGGVFYEHSHRVLASIVGFLVAVLTIWIVLKDKRRWLKNLAFFSFGLVLLQALLGGLTVLYKLPVWFSASHGILGQTFFCVMIIIAWAHSKTYFKEKTTASVFGIKKLNFYTWILFIAVYCQLIAGALMRHTESALAVPDFPTIGGKLIPSISEETVAIINKKLRTLGLVSVDSIQVLLHIIHRFGGYIVCFLTILLFINATKLKGEIGKHIYKHVSVLFVIVFIQVTLGIFVILTVRNPIVSSLHVMLGAGFLAISLLLILKSHKVINDEA